MNKKLDAIANYYNSIPIIQHVREVQRTGSKKILCDLLYLMTVGCDLSHPANKEMKQLHNELIPYTKEM